MQIGESTQTNAEEQPEEPVGDKKPVKVRCVLLYDGTGNNKTNIQSRLDDKEGHYKRSKSLWSTIKGGNDSYENFFTNIASLDTYTEKEPAEGFDITIKIYTEGIGTRDNNADERLGLGIGTWIAGVKAKCTKGITKAIGKILVSKIKEKDLDPEMYYFEQLHFDIFGFSRGAAAARHAAYKLMLEEEKTIKDNMRLKGFEVREAKIRFMGLFDTVSSHGVNFNDDVDKLRLRAIGEAEAVVQLAAADEYRKNFSLTNIASAGTKGTEYFMPGAHSDVGGSYHDNDDPYKSEETFTLYSGTPHEVKQDARQLIAEGWYKLDNDIQEIEYEEIYNDFGQPIQAYTKAKRVGISNAYCRIPLKVMAREAKKQLVPINYSELEIASNEIINKYNELAALASNIDEYMVTDMALYQRCAPLLIKVRNKHLHMSAKEKFGMGPRFEGKGEARHRERRIHEG
ncbi:MAG: hypothetical protein B0W54_23695 [Cellvibrio sp. 79]|nr:MAG: hypothetical protein B0W54_23695 [Cellvibrio sp. 79]